MLLRESIICFVTIGGKPEFAEPSARFNVRSGTQECDDAYFAAFLNNEYGRIKAQAHWYGRLFTVKTIGAVEFQKVHFSRALATQMLTSSMIK